MRTSTRPMLYLLGGGGGAGAADRVCQRHQPAGWHARCHGGARRRSGSGRRQPRAAGPPVADRIGAAGARRRPLRAAARPVGCAAAPPRRDSCRDRPRRQLRACWRLPSPWPRRAASSPAWRRFFTPCAATRFGASRRRRLRRHRRPRGALAARVRGLSGRGEPDAAGRRRLVPAHAAERPRHRPRLQHRSRRWWRISISTCAAYSQEAGQAVYGQILDRLQAAPGVAAAGAARVTVLSGGARTVSISVDGQRIREDGANGLDVRLNVVSDGYLRALGIPIAARSRLHARRRPRSRCQSRSSASRSRRGCGPASSRSAELIGDGEDTASGGGRGARTRSTSARSSATRRRFSTCRWRRTTSRA